MKDEMRVSFRRIPNKALFILFALGFLVRAALLPTEGFKNDISLWQNWALKIKAFGIERVYEPVWRLPTGGMLGVVNHPPVNLYYLKLVSPVTTRLPYLDPLSNIAIKLPSLVFDILAMFMLMLLGRTLAFGEPAARFGALLYWLNPAIIYHGAFWGLNESVSAFVWLAMLYCLLTKRYSLALAISIGSISIKLQNLIFIPLVALTVFFRPMVHVSRFTFQEVSRGFIRIFKGVLLGVGLVSLVYLPFVIAGTFKQAFEVLTHSVGYFPSLTKGAFNLWYIVDSATHFAVGDGELALGFLSYRTIGLALFVIATLIHCFLVAKFKFRPNILILAFVVQGFSFFMLPTEMHERYIFYAIPFVPLLVAYGARWYWLYGALSFLYLANLVVVYNDYYGGFHSPQVLRYVIVGFYIVCYGVLWKWYIQESTKPQAPASTRIEASQIPNKSQ